MFNAQLGRIAPREGESMSGRHCEPTGRREALPDDRLREAIHFTVRRKNGLLRRFAPWRKRFAFVAAMTTRYAFAFSRRDAPGLCVNFRPRKRAQGKPGARRTRSLVCKGRKHTSSHHRFAGTPGLPCAMVLTVSFALSPVIGLFCHRHLQD